MRFTTTSGSTYELTEEQAEPVETEPLASYGRPFSAYLIREGVPLVHVMTGGAMETLYAQRVYFSRPPIIGESFVYVTESHGVVYSTPVAEIED